MSKLATNWKIRQQNLKKIEGEFIVKFSTILTPYAEELENSYIRGDKFGYIRNIPEAFVTTYEDFNDTGLDYEDKEDVWSKVFAKMNIGILCSYCDIYTEDTTKVVSFRFNNEKSKK